MTQMQRLGSVRGKQWSAGLQLSTRPCRKSLTVRHPNSWCMYRYSWVHLFEVESVCSSICRYGNDTTNSSLYQCCSGLCIDLLFKLSEKMRFDYELFQVEDGLWGGYDEVILLQQCAFYPSMLYTTQARDRPWFELDPLVAWLWMIRSSCVWTIHHHFCRVLGSGMAWSGPLWMRKQTWLSPPSKSHQRETSRLPSPFPFWRLELPS